MKFHVKLTILLGLVPLVALAAGAPQAAAPPQPFTATYKVLRKGSPLGVSTLSLRRDADGAWAFRSKLEAESGLAALLNGGIDETSRFRWHDGRIESLSYDYKLHTSLKSKQRHVEVDWKGGMVSVHTGGDGDFNYKPKPGLVERHLLVLALGRAVRAGQKRIALPVAVKDRVETQTFVVRGTETIEVPAGKFKAVRVERTRDDKDYTVWYAPERFGNVPVKVSQASGGGITLLLKSCQRK